MGHWGKGKTRRVYKPMIKPLFYEGSVCVSTDNTNNTTDAFFTYIPLYNEV